VSAEIPDRVAAIFEADEALLWQGRPDARLRFPLEFMVASAFGLAFFCVGVFELGFNPWRPRGFDLLSSLIGAFSVTFMLFGLYLMVGTFLVDAYQRRKTRYFLTDRRAILMQDAFPKPSVTTYPITPEMQIELRNTTPPSVLFEDTIIQHEDETELRRTGFEFIADAKTVYELMLGVQRGNT